MGDDDPSIVEYFGLGSGHHCGYCKGEDSNISTGMWAHSLRCQDYLSLMDRGWRRSGLYVYKPEMKLTCCPQYPIRCDASQFQPSKSQKKVLKKMSRFLKFGKVCTEKDKANSDTGNFVEDASEFVEEFHRDNVTPHAKTEDLHCDAPDGKVASIPNAVGSVDASEVTHNATSNTGKQPSEKCHSSLNSGHAAEKGHCRKAKDIRRERRERKVQQRKQNDGGDKVNDCYVAKNLKKTFEDYIEETNGDSSLMHRLEVKLVRSSPPEDDFVSSLAEEHAVFKKYQMNIHNDTEDECTLSKFERFLITCPLVAEDNNEVIPGYGAFHYQYRIDGKLIGVSVLDILHDCISSKYFFYDTDYSFLSLGTYSALSELYWMRSVCCDEVSMRYYYMGFYIHSCAKMRYKGQYHPSFLLCPESYAWVPISKCRPLLDKHKYSRLNDEVAEVAGDVMINSALVLHRRRAMTFQQYTTSFLKSDAEGKLQRDAVQRYANLVGRECAERMLLYRK